MPARAKRPCAHPGCPALVDKGRCSAHAVQGPGWERWQAKHGSSTERGYGREWRKVRDVYIAAHPQCEWCGAQAQEVDHIRPKAHGGTDDTQNLRALCHDCHKHRPTAHQAPAWLRGGAA